MLKAERMKNKMSGGKTLVTIDNIQIRFSQIELNMFLVAFDLNCLLRV